MRKFLNELRRRNVLRVAVAYFAAAWLIVQVLETVIPIFDLPEAYIRWAIIVMGILLIPALALSWAFEFSMGRIKSQGDIDRGIPRPRREMRNFDRTIIAVLTLAVVYFAVDKFLIPSISLGIEDVHSVAVMPFVDMTSGQDAAYLGDGVAEDLLNLLSRNSNVRVVARRSTFGLRNSGLPIAEIAARLGASHVLEGSVRTDDQRVRITAQLVSGRNGYNVWSNVFDRDIDEIFTIKNEILAQVESALGVMDTASTSTREPPPAEVYVMTLRANYLSKDATNASRTQSIDLYLRALELDPDYALAWCNLATTYNNQAIGGYIAWDDGYRKARDAALKCISSDPQHAGGYRVLSFISRYFEGDMNAAVSHMQRALDEDPTALAIIEDAGTLLLNIGQIADAVRIQEHLVARSPVDVISFWNLALRYRYADRLAESERAYRRVIELNPDTSEIDYNLGETLLLMGRHQEALVQFEDEEDEAYRLKGQALAFHALGQGERAKAALTSLIERFGDKWPSEIAHVYAYRGDLDEAFTWLDKEYDTYGPGGWGEWQLQRLYDKLRDDPRWLLFLKRTGTAPEQLASIQLNVPSEIWK